MPLRRRELPSLAGNILDGVCTMVWTAGGRTEQTRLVETPTEYSVLELHMVVGHITEYIFTVINVDLH